jgi:phosphate starvation-inducible PhoH-like protein
MRLGIPKILFCHFNMIFSAKGRLHNMSMRKKLDYDYKPGSLYLPKTVNQVLYVKHLSDSRVPLVFGIGPAGSGKTLFACASAIEQYKQGLIKKIVLTRPLVSVQEEELGFLPGSVFNKMEPWTRPIFDVFHEYCSKKEIELMLKNGDIEISPLAYMRGRTFKRSFIIADEMQNSSPNQMLMLLTRVGEDSKMVVTGDLKQSDLPDAKNGLHDFLLKWRTYPLLHVKQSIQVVEFNTTDICRSNIVSLVLDVYNQTVAGQTVEKTFNNDIFVSSVVVDKNLSITIITDYLDEKKKDGLEKETIKKIYDNDAAMIPLWNEPKSTF